MDNELLNLKACQQNVYRLQVGGLRLCEALRKIADGCADPEKVALAALNHKEPDPDWVQLDELRAENARYRIALKRIAGPDGFRNNNEYDPMNIAAKALGATNADP